MERMSGEQRTLTLLAAYWAGTNVVFTGMKVLDWLPMRAALSAASLVLFVIMIALPRFAEPGDAAARDQFTIVCYVAATVPLAGFVIFFVTGITEYRYLRGLLAARQKRRIEAANRHAAGTA